MIGEGKMFTDFIMTTNVFKKEIFSGLILVLCLISYIIIPDKIINDFNRSNVDCTGLIASCYMQGHF